MEEYSSGLVSESFWFLEMKNMLDERHNGLSWEDLKEKCVHEQFFGNQKEYRANRIFGYLKRRISFLDEPLETMFFTQPLATQKIINVIAIARGNRLFYEFLYDEYREKLLLNSEQLTVGDINRFFHRKQSQIEEIAKWKEPTIKRLKGAYMNFCTESEIVVISGSDRLIKEPILSIELDDYLKENQPQMWKIWNGVG